LMRGRRKRDPLEGVNLLELAPVRIARWDEVEGRVVVERPAPRGIGPGQLLDWLLHMMSVKKLRLDEVGSLAWQLLDGDHTVTQVAEAVRERFGEAVEPAEERVGLLIRTLRREGLVAYPGWDSIPDQGTRDPSL